MKAMAFASVVLLIIGGGAPPQNPQIEQKDVAPDCYKAPLAVDPTTQAVKNLEGRGVKKVDSGLRIAGPTEGGIQCHSNQCYYPSPTRTDWQCATCIRVSAPVPSKATVLKISCFTNAQYTPQNPGDYKDPVEVPCGSDQAWAYFSGPSERFEGSDRFIDVWFHNRSHNRARAARLEVTYRE